MKKGFLFYGLLTGVVFSAGFMAGNINNDITKQTIGEAQKLFSLNFTEQEQDSMQDNLREYRKFYENLHQLPLKNDINPAIYFNAVLPGMVVNQKQETVLFDLLAKVELPIDKAALAFYNIPQLAWLIKNKKITVVELTSFFIRRLKQYDPQLKCVIS